MPATPFVGRRQETAEIRRLLPTTRLLTLAGPPGVGKTRLALHALQATARSFRDGTYFVDLGGLRDPALLAQEVAGRVGLHDASTRWALEELVRHLGDRNVLVVVDNCEHLLDACAVLIDSLVRTCGGLRVMATSRQSLGIPAEMVYRVRPLAVPEEGSVQAEAVELLLVRGRAIQPQHGRGEEMEPVAELCRRLEGLPLAIELAAVRLKTLSVEQIIARLDDRFAVLGETNRAAPPHQRTLRAALDWSRDLMSEQEWLLWQRLSVFPTSFELSAVEGICSAEGLERGCILDALDALVDKSIVSATRVGPEMRYRLLDSVREYGAEALRGSGDAVFRRRHRDHYASLCEVAWQQWTGPEQPAWFDRMEREHDNLRAALDWSAENLEPDAGAAMAANMWLYWEARGHLTEGRRRLVALLDDLPAQSESRPKALWVAGYLALAQTDVEAALPLLETSVDAAETSDDSEALAFATQYLGLCALFGGDLRGAAQALERAFEMHIQHGERAGAFTLADLAITAMLMGDTPGALALFEQALSLAEDPWTRAHCLWGTGVAKWQQGDLEGAEHTEKEALRHIAQVDERSGTALCMNALAWIAASRQNFERAALLDGAALAVWDSIPRCLPAPLREHEARCERLTRRGLGSETRDRVFEAGRRLDRAAAVAVGLETEEQPLRRSAAAPDTGSLSRREREVAELVAAGLSDRDIAARLVISQRTAESHVQHILTKLGFRSRTQIAAWVATRSAISV